MRRASLLLSICALVNAHTTLETTKASIISILVRENPRALVEFALFFAQYDERVRKFFDYSNTEPLSAHIQQMERELEVIHAVCDNRRFRSVQHLLIDHCRHVANLISVLKNHVGSCDTLSVAYNVRKFKKLLPCDVANRGDLQLFWALHHRLRC